jgi:hypothetical protein
VAGFTTVMDGLLQVVGVKQVVMVYMESLAHVKKHKHEYLM